MNRTLRLPALLSALVVGAGLLAASAPAASGTPTDTTPARPPTVDPADPPATRPNLDVREDADGPKAGPVRAAPRPPASRADLRRRLGPQGVVDVDPTTGTPRMVARLDGLLTGPSDRPAAAVALRYVRAHRAAFGLDRSDLAQLHLWRKYVDIGGTTHLVWQQRVGGVPAFDNGLRAAVDAQGRLVAVYGSPLQDLSVDPRPALSSTAARTAALRDVGVRAPEPADVRAKASGAQRAVRWADGDRAELVFFGGLPGGPRLAWQVNARASDVASYVSVVDAASGRILWRSNLVFADTGSGNAWENYPNAPVGGAPEPVTFPVFKGDRLRGNNAHVYKDLRDTIVVPGDKVPASAEIPATSGLDWSGYAAALDTTDAGRNCSVLHPCTWNSAEAFSWRANASSAGVQVYHYLNTFHDHLESAPVGFTEDAGNFQAVNERGHGLGSDAVKAQIADGANTADSVCKKAAVKASGFPDSDHVTNANMEVAQDGVPPKMQMYLWPSGPRRCVIGTQSPETNGGDDASIVYHEYTHGLSNRLVTTNTGVPALDTFQGASMGEAWSDWYAMDYLETNGLETDGPQDGDFLVGRYPTGGRGVRTEGMDCTPTSDPAGCPGVPGFAGPGGFTYGDLTRIQLYRGKPVAEVHADGEIWGQTLWELRASLGSEVMLTLVTRAMELSPPHPSFLDMRNAVMLADQVAYDGANADELWRVFALRGMGYFADTDGPNDFRPTENFDVPATCPGPSCATVYGRVVDSVTGRAVAGARVVLAGHGSLPGQGPPVELSGLTNADGHFQIDDVPHGTYPRLVVDKRGFERRERADVVVQQESRRVDLTLVRDWASRQGGARVTKATGPDYDSELGCGPRRAIDLDHQRGWMSDAVSPPDGLVPGPKSVVIRLPRPIRITTIGLDPSAACVDFDDSIALKAFTIATRKSKHAAWVTAVRRDKALPLHRTTLLRPADGAKKVRYVKLVMRSNRWKPGAGRGGRTNMGMAELTVHGRAPVRR